MRRYLYSRGIWPEAVHPAALNDCLGAYNTLIKNGYKCDNIIIRKNYFEIIFFKRGCSRFVLSQILLHPL
jgi:hypothetical protein